MDGMSNVSSDKEPDSVNSKKDESLTDESALYNRNRRCKLNIF
jgi:hypothetical protein